jgi:hypothetical protein
MINEMDYILSESQSNESSLQDLIKEFEAKKNIVNESIEMFFGAVLRFVSDKKNEILEKLNSIHSKNCDNILDKADFLCIRINNAKEFKERIISLMNGNFHDVKETFNEYNMILKFYNENANSLNFEIEEISFFHEEENKIYKAFSNFADLKLKRKFIKLQNEAKKITKGKSSKENGNLKNKNSFNADLFGDIITNNQNENLHFNKTFKFEREYNSNKLDTFNSKNDGKFSKQQSQLKINHKDFSAFNNKKLKDTFEGGDNRNQPERDISGNYIPISKNPLFVNESPERNYNNLNQNLNVENNNNNISKQNLLQAKNKNDVFRNNRLEKFDNLPIIDTTDIINNDYAYGKAKSAFNYNDAFYNDKPKLESRLGNIQKNANVDFRKENLFNNDSRLLYKYDGGLKKIYYEATKNNNNNNEYHTSKLKFCLKLFI